MADNTNEKDIVTYVLACREEAAEAKRDRMDLNRDNYEMYHMKHDFSHKTRGQSTEVLAKQRMAVEQTKSFFQQAIADLGEWFDITPADGSEGEQLVVRPYEAKALLTFMQRQAHYFSHIGNAIQTGLLGALIVTKTTGKMCPKPKFVVRKDGKGKSFRKHVEKIDNKSWEMVTKVVRQEDYFPDPTGNKLYEIEEMYMDLHEVRALAKGETAIYNLDVVNQLSTAVTEDPIEQGEKERETGQNTVITTGHRPKVKLTEFWGNVIDREGNITHENVVITIANDRHVIRKPTPNPNWHQKSPYTVAPLLEVANSVWPIALMDAPTKHNRTIIELNNLILDAAFKKVHAISQIRVQHLVDQSQVSDGIPSGTALRVKNTLPPGAKVMEPVETVDVPNDAINVLNILQQEFNAAALTNDLRQGVMPSRAVKATEVVEASQTITSIFQGIAKNIESKFIQPEIELEWATIANHWDLIDKDIFIKLFGKERGEQLSQLDPEDVFVDTVNGFAFRVFGISQTLSKAQDFRKLTTLLQTIGNSDVLIEAFVSGFDFKKLLGEIMSSLDIDKHKLAIPVPLGGPTESLERQAEGQGGPEGPGMGPNNDMSQIAAPRAETLSALFQGGVPQTNFGG